VDNSGRRRNEEDGEGRRWGVGERKDESRLSEGVPEGQSIGINVPPELEDGVYANFAVVHHTQHEVTIDFRQLGTNPGTPDDPVIVKVVSRVHIPPTFVGPLLQAVSENAFRREDALQKLEEGEADES
jgi:hypothetical protein